VILGGSIGGRSELLERVERILPECMRRPPATEASALGSRAAISGALALGLEELHRLTHGNGFAEQGLLAPVLTVAPARSSE
jgi:hypothetical protein